MPLERDVVKVETKKAIEEKSLSKDQQVSKFAPIKELRDYQARIAKGEKLRPEEESQFQQLLKKRQDKKARLAQVLERGVVAERLNVPLPNDRYGEWVAADPQEVSRMEQLGFWVDKEFAKSRRLHSEGDEVSYIGDAVFMVCERETHELLEEVRIERKNAMHGLTGEKGKEEKDYSTKLQTHTPEVPVIDDSKAKRAGKEDILSAAEAGYRK